MYEEKERAHLKAKEGARIAKELRLKDEEEEQAHLKAQEEARFPDELTLKAEE